jgi:hypothetical protein
MQEQSAACHFTYEGAWSIICAGAKIKTAKVKTRPESIMLKYFGTILFQTSFKELLLFLLLLAVVLKK